MLNQFSLPGFDDGPPNDPPGTPPSGKAPPRPPHKGKLP